MYVGRADAVSPAEGGRKVTDHRAGGEEVHSAHTIGAGSGGLTTRQPQCADQEYSTHRGRTEGT